jgi:LacI family transcriptional regulator
MTKSKNLPTYAQIATKAGVSTKTAYNVLINPGIVRKKTMDKVLKVLPHFGVDDPSAMKTKRRLAGPGNQKTLLFLEDAQVSAMSSPVFAMIVRAAETHAHSLGWQLLIRHKNENSTLEESIRDFRGHGVILFGNKTPLRELHQVFPEMPTARILAPPPGGPDCDNVDYDRAEVPRIAARHLKKAGCKRVAYIGSDSGVGAKHHIRCELFLAEAKNLGMDASAAVDNEFFLSDGTTQTINREALEAAWKKVEHSHPEGVFIVSDQATNGLYPLWASKGALPMKDFQVISCNAEQLWLAPLHPKPATIDIHSDELGRRAVETILWRIKNKSAPLSSVILAPTLVEPS